MLGATMALASSVAGSPTPALALSFLSVATEGEVGTPTGVNQAMIVFDWDAGTTESHAWLYRWDGSATLADAFDAIVSAEGGAFSWSQDPFVQFIHYADDDGDNHVSAAPGWISFWGSADGESWSTTASGVYDELLADGGWAGANANLPSGTWPGGAPSVPVPEPGTALLVGLGLTGMAVRQRRSRVAA